MQGWLRYDSQTTHMYATSDPYVESLDELGEISETGEIVVDF